MVTERIAAHRNHADRHGREIHACHYPCLPLGDRHGQETAPAHAAIRVHLIAGGVLATVLSLDAEEAAGAVEGGIWQNLRRKIDVEDLLSLISEAYAPKGAQRTSHSIGTSAIVDERLMRELKKSARPAVAPEAADAVLSTSFIAASCAVARICTPTADENRRR